MPASRVRRQMMRRRSWGAGAATPAGSFPSVPTAGGFVALALTAAASGTHAWTVGHTFKQGDMPAGQGLSGVQCIVKSTWPDGSAKVAVLSGGCAMTAGASRTVALVKATAPTGAALTTAELKATGITAGVDAGAFGAASWAGTDWDAPFQSWVSGPLMSSWVYRKPIGGDAHLVAWLEVRLWTNGAVEVLPWIENGYVNVAAPTNKLETYTFTLGGTERFSAVIDLKHHQRTPLLNGTPLSHWLAADPGVVPLHDPAYLQATELVPSYLSALPPGSALVTAQTTTYAPLQQGRFTYDSDNMASSGYQQPIGLLPEHDVLHLIADQSDRPVTYGSVIRNGYSAGRYGIHYRDENTNRPLRFSDHPTRVITSSQGFRDNGSSTTNTRTPVVTGGNPPQWDVAHHPSVGFVAYLLTGRWYFMEEVLFAATCNYLGNGDNTLLRTGVQGLVQTAFGAWQTRSSAWDWRTQAQALAVVPDADTALRTELLNRTNANIDYFHATYVAQPNNQFGMIMPGETYDGGLTRLAVWQQDMVTAAWGYSKALRPPVDSTRQAKLDAFFAWKAQSIVGRLGTVGDFPFENANRYNIQLGGSLSQSSYKLGTGPWPADWAEIYALTAPLATSPDNPLATAGGNALAQEYDTIAAAKGQWGTLQMAIAYAVRFGVAGASAAYQRMTGASNWASMLVGNWTSGAPVMAVKPLRDPAATPAWLADKPLNQWFTIPGSNASSVAPATIFADYSGVVVGGSKVRAFGGGHGGSADNTVAVIDLSVDAPAWSVEAPPTPGGERVLATNAVALAIEQLWWGTAPNLKPNPPHTYSSGQWVESLQRVIWFGQRGPWSWSGDVGSFNRLLQWVPGAGAWVQPGSAEDVLTPPMGRCTVQLPDGTIYGSNGGSTIYKFDPAQPFGSQFSPWVTNGALNWNGYGQYLHDAAHSRILRIGDLITPRYFSIHTGTQAVTDLSPLLNGNAGVLSGLNSRVVADTCGACIDPVGDRIVIPTGAAGGGFYAINLNTWEVTLETPAVVSGHTISGTPLAGANPAGLFGRIHYLPQYRGILYAPHAAAPLAFMRLA